MPGVIIHTSCHTKVSLTLVDGVVGEVHAEVVEVFLICLHRERLVLLGCEPYDSVLIKEDLERITAEYEHIEPQVKFQTVNQIWV